MKKLLILGGTEFVGRQLLEVLSRDDFDIYLFNRGKTNPELFPEVTRIIGDRQTDDIKKIAAHNWDIVIDFSSYFPKSLERTLEHINKDVQKYIFISTISVYSFKDYDGTHPITEDFKRKSYQEDQLTEPSLKYYGEKKVACEDILNKATWLNRIILRPSVIYGKYDPTDRLYYWLERLQNKEKLLLPYNGMHSVTYTYSQDMVNIILDAIENPLKNKTLNCVSNETLTMSELLELCKEQMDSSCEFIPVDLRQLKKEQPNIPDFPLSYGMNLIIDNSRLNSTLDIELTPIKKSIRSTIDYYQNIGWPKPKVGMPYEEEDGLIENQNS